jgi:hypothetical protein
MAIPAPSVDQVTAQLRIIIPALGTIVTALGVSQAQAGSLTQIALASVGPIAYVITAIWSLVANSRASILKAAAKPGGPNMEKPQIVLPKEEAALAQQLPDNVNTTATVKVVSQ